MYVHLRLIDMCLVYEMSSMSDALCPSLEMRLVVDSFKTKNYGTLFINHVIYL